VSDLVGSNAPKSMMQLLDRQADEPKEPVRYKRLLNLKTKTAANLVGADDFWSLSLGTQPSVVMIDAE
jgi:hypothetical protein